MIIEKNKMSSPASNTCPRFIRNAWKKDLCSNCFKPKEEHAEPPKVEINTLLTWELNELPPPPSILKSAGNKPGRGSGVTFNAEESEVIGYGGNDEFSDDEDDDFFDENPKYEGEDLPDTEYEKELQKLTKSNTDFNSVTENLNKDPSENSQPVTPLKLGRPDLNQAKATPVLVTVQPFGSNATKAQTKISVNTTMTSNVLSKSFNSVTDGLSKPSLIPKPVSENVTKTSVNSKNNDTSIVSKSSTPENNTLGAHDVHLLNKSDSQNKVAQPASVNIVSTNSSETTTSPPKLLSWKTLSEQKTETDCSKTETNKAVEPVVKNAEEEIKILNDEEDTHQVKRNNSGNSTESKSRKCLQRGNVITKSHEIVKSKIIQQNKGDLDDTLDSLVDSTDLPGPDKTEPDNHVTNININSQVDDKSNIFTNKNIFLKKEICEKINNVINKNHQSKLEFLNKDIGVTNDWVTVESIDCRSEEDVVCISSNPESPQDSSLEDANMFTCEREKIGEPDGKADSDSSEHAEPPALPKIPPPYEDSNDKLEPNKNHAPPPRSSFLHNKKVANNEAGEPKPKIGVKPNGLLFSIPQQFSSPTTKLNGFLNNNNKDIKINSLKIQSNYVELKKKNSDYDFVNFSKNDLYGTSDNADKLSTSSEESLKLYKEHNLPSSSNSSPGTYKFIAEPDNMYYTKNTSSSHPDTVLQKQDRNILSNTTPRSNQNKTVESELNEMIDSKIIFDKEYENVVKSSTSSRLESMDLKDDKKFSQSELQDHQNQTYVNFNDAIDRLNGLEEKFNPIYNYSRSRSNSYDENFSDSVHSRCETPMERTKRQAPKPPPTPPPSSGGKGKPLAKPPLVYPKPDPDMITPPPRKSSSTDCLAEKYAGSDKLAKKIGSSTAATRMRHTLKKFLRLGKEDVDFSAAVTSPAPRPRPQIIHPIDYNKPGVEVLRSGGTSMSNKENQHDSSNGVPTVTQQSKDLVYV
ncbi:hypothetical protein M8J75_011852 [Diaphorina citri]|nr:hypothetical protein M8J75_011852 [Diaphorina citri]